MSMRDDNNTQRTANNHVISGDLFEGIAVSEYCDQTFDIQSDGRHGQIIMRVTKPKPDRICVGFLFLLDAPMRFRVDVLVPDECTNARVSLQDQELIGFFSPDIPDDPDPVISMPCGQHDKISTLHPGTFQSINFRWESGDVLKFYFYYGKNKSLPLESM
jgi:hypothetical protein